MNPVYGGAFAVVSHSLPALREGSIERALGQKGEAAVKWLDSEKQDNARNE